jgi:hypothetical protein
MNSVLPPKLTKWMVLDTPEKLATLKASKLYAGYSSRFNDVFDSQLRFSENDKANLLEQTIKLVKKLPSMNSDPRAESQLFIERLIEYIHGMNIASFSGLNPLDSQSNHMWGLYGNCGHGIALEYKTDDILAHINNNPMTQNTANIYRVCYFPKEDDSTVQNRNNKLKWFNELVRNMLGNGFNSDFHNKLFSFFVTKSHEWNAEEECRFVYTPKIIAEIFGVKLPDWELYKSEMDKYKLLVTNSSFDFILPTQIVFGWNIHNNKNWEAYAYAEVEKWAKSNHIKCIYLDDKLNYAENKFKTRAERLP